MDRRLDPNSRWNRDRRIADASRLARLLVERDAVTFDELLAAAAPRGASDVATWLAHAIDGGLVEELPPEPRRPRRFALRRTEAEQAWRRRHQDPPGISPPGTA